MTDKQSIRLELNKQRNSLSLEQVREYSKSIWEKIYATDIFQEAQTVLLYSSIGKEVDTKQAFEYILSTGKKVAYPKTDTNTYTMAFYYVDSLEDLQSTQSGKFTLLEPKPIGENLVEPDAYTLIVVPGLGFDTDMYRVGYGGGFYDKYLHKYSSSPTIGVCYDFQLIPSVFPEPHDQPLQYIVTPNMRLSATSR